MGRPRTNVERTDTAGSPAAERSSRGGVNSVELTVPVGSMCWGLREAMVTEVPWLRRLS